MKIPTAMNIMTATIMTATITSHMSVPSAAKTQGSSPLDVLGLLVSSNRSLNHLYVLDISRQHLHYHLLLPVIENIEVVWEDLDPIDELLPLITHLLLLLELRLLSQLLDGALASSAMDGVHKFDAQGLDFVDRASRILDALWQGHCFSGHLLSSQLRVWQCGFCTRL